MTEGVELLRGTGPGLGPLARRYPAEQRTLLRVLRDQAAERGDHPWVVFDGRDTLTFDAAWRLTCRVASAVRERVRPGAHVALMLRNQPEFLPAFYGPMAAGGVTIPLNPDARGPLLADVIRRSDADVVVVRTDLLDVLGRLDDLGAVRLLVACGPGERPGAVHGVEVITWEEWLDGASDEPPATLPAHHATALLQFTSGTTGRQKGAIYSHHFLFLYAAMITDAQGHGPDAVLMTPLPLCHVAALHLVANSALQAGCTAHLRSRFSASEYWQQAADCGATWSIILGPMAAMVAKLSAEPPAHRVGKIFCVPPPPEAAAFERRFGVQLLWQGYGMTEVYPLPMPARLRPGASMDTIGMPVEWMDYGVVDEHDALLPPGEVGELVFRPLLPYGMVDGYYRDPEATVTAFRNFAFHTGDLATYDDEGLLHYRGRKQERIRVRGENVSAGEVEFVALGHPAVVEAAAYGVPAEIGEEDLKLDVVLKESVDLGTLHAWLESNLPRHMVPRYLERRDAFPKTPSERIQKWRLTGEPLDRAEVFDAGPRRRRREAGATA